MHLLFPLKNDLKTKSMFPFRGVGFWWIRRLKANAVNCVSLRFRIGITFFISGIQSAKNGPFRLKFQSVGH